MKREPRLCMDGCRKGARSRRGCQDVARGGGRGGVLEELIKADDEDLMARAAKEIESALGNKTMNDASKARLSYRGRV